MAKQSIPQASYPVNNVRLLPDQVKGDAPFVKETFDKGTEDGKTYINSTLIPALNGNTGANMIGLSNLNLASNNVADGIEEVRVIAVQAQAGEILPNSITNEQLGIDVKVGSLFTLNTTEKTTVTNAINELDGEIDTIQTDVSNLSTSATTNATGLEILRKYNVTTGSNVALAVDTFGTFDLTKTGNILNILPNVTNTGAMTINPDGQGAKAIKKFNVDTDAYVDVEALDIKKNTPTSLSWDLANNFFVLAPKGANPLDKFKKPTSVYKEAGTTATLTQRLNVSGQGWIVMVAQSRYTTTLLTYKLIVDGVYVVGSATTGNTLAQGQSNVLMIRFNSSFQYFDSDPEHGVVVYKLGTNIEKSTINVYSTRTDATAVTQKINVTGKGWFLNVNSDNNGVAGRIVIDGVNIQPTGRLLAEGFYMHRFETSLAYFSSATTEGVATYILD